MTRRPNIRGYVTNTKELMRSKGSSHEEQTDETKPIGLHKYYPLASKHQDDFTYDFYDLKISVNTNNFFNAKESNINPGFLSLKNKEDCLRLIKNPLSFYQNQFNMAIWFATTGCGISINDHLNNNNHLISSIYRFHAYYQIMKIFKNL
ncbi:hypothetical protein, partial [Bartonella sp. CL42QHWL]|uniref:hypothetical protein n=1 Tax=Bartonella sp. CL42QHWL TaxID=3243528 RepID=UPI0035D0C8D3